MATTGTATFNMDFTEIAEEAFERAGRELRTGYDLKTARRSMNLLTIEWQNRGLNMWTMEEGVISLVAGQVEYDLPADTIDLMEFALRNGSGATQSDLIMSRISAPTYASIPNKTVQGRPIQAVIIRGRDNPSLKLYPVPDSANYSIYYWRLRRIQDAGSGIQTADVNFRFLPCLVAGLAYYIAMKYPESAERIPLLKQEYEMQFQLAAEEDREKASISFTPRISRY